MPAIPFPLSLLVEAVDMVTSTSLKPLKMTGVYKISPPLLSSRSHSGTNVWTINLHDFTYEICNGHPVWGTFSFGVFRGIMRIDHVENQPASPPMSGDGDGPEEGEVEDPPPPDAEANTKVVTPLWNHIWQPGQKIHFRWRGSKDPALTSNYSAEDLSPRKRRCFAPPLISTMSKLPFSRSPITASSIPRNSSWAGSGEIVFLDGDNFQLIFRNQEEVWQLDGSRTENQETGVWLEEHTPWNIVDGYGRGWYEFFWLAERHGDWKGDPEAETLKRL